MYCIFTKLKILDEYEAISVNILEKLINSLNNQDKLEMEINKSNLNEILTEENKNIEKITELKQNNISIIDEYNKLNSQSKIFIFYIFIFLRY